MNRSFTLILTCTVVKFSRDFHKSSNSSGTGAGWRGKKETSSLDKSRAIYFTFQVENECGEIPTVLVQNKMDLVDQCVIDP